MRNWIHLVLGDNPARLRLMAENPNAVLYMSVSVAARNAQAGVAIKSPAHNFVPYMA